MNDTSEILKSSAGAIDKAADLLHQLAGPAFEEFGAMLGDKVRVYRVKNMIKTMQKTERLLHNAGLPVNAVPPRLLLPIIEGSSIEDNEYLQELWAGLLATASQQTDSVSPSFVETLKQLTPDEARHLKHVCEEAQKLHRRELGPDMSLTGYAFTKAWGTPAGVSSDTYERLGLVRRDYDVKLRTRGPRATSAEELAGFVATEIGYQFVITRYAAKFLEACQGPRPSQGIEQSPSAET